MAIPPPPPSNPEISSEPRRTTKETHPHLPPGLILDENGKVCKVCNTWQDFAKMNKGKSTTSEGSSSGSGSKVKGLGGMAGFASLLNNTSSTPSASQMKVVPIPTEVEPDRTNCPPDTAALGRSTWTFLHTTASYYPQKPTETQQSKMISLLDSLSTFYPCSWCAKDFQKDMKVNPPEVKTRDEFVKWLCERHNTVNRKLGKPVFECSLGKLDGRWKDGPEDGSCD